MPWRAGDRKTRYLCALALAAGAVILAAYGRKIASDWLGRTEAHPAQFGDFFALWSCAHIAVTQSAAILYQSSQLHALQVALGMPAAAQNPFPYPPAFILLIWPLGLLPYPLAYAVWTFGTLALFLWAVLACCSRLPVCLFGVIVFPASIATIAAGQSGFLTAALLTAGIRLAGARPAVAGALLGVLACKPQLAILVPVALIAAGCWRTGLFACATALMLSAVATLAFGWAVWPAWIAMLPDYAAAFDRATLRLTLMPTVMANLRLAGVSLPLAQALQAVAAAAVAVLVWGCFRRTPGRLAAAALLTGTFLATPHALIYDLPMVGAAMTLVIQDRLETTAEFALPEVGILLLTFFSPVMMMIAGPPIPATPVSLALFLGMILWRLRQAPRPAGVQPIRPAAGRWR